MSNPFWVPSVAIALVLLHEMESHHEYSTTTIGAFVGVMAVAFYGLLKQWTSKE